MRCAAVIAAAGLSSRMRDFKPLLSLGDTTIIERVIEGFRLAGVEEIVVVTGYRADLLRGRLHAPGVRCVENPRFAETKMFDSLCIGLRALTDGYDRVFLTPGDVPLVREKTLRQMLAAEAAVVRPVCRGEAGHPILVRSSAVPRLLNYDGRGGLRGALGALDEPVLDLAVEDSGITLDADTPEDLRRLRRQMETRSGGRLRPELQIQIARGDTVLTPETVQLLEMIGHTGSIKSACGCMHMSCAKGRMLLGRIGEELGYPVIKRSPGGSALTEKGRRLLAAYQAYREALQEAAERLFSRMFPDDLTI